MKRKRGRGPRRNRIDRRQTLKCGTTFRSGCGESSAWPRTVTPKKPAAAANITRPKAICWWVERQDRPVADEAEVRAEDFGTQSGFAGNRATGGGRGYGSHRHRRHGGTASSAGRNGSGKDLAVASKEILVMAGEKWSLAAARKRGVKILPVDSEHTRSSSAWMGAASEVGAGLF